MSYESECNGRSNVFPNVEDNDYGLTKRELFAAMNHAALLTNPASGPSRAEFAVTEADALLAALAKAEGKRE